MFKKLLLIGLIVLSFTQTTFALEFTDVNKDNLFYVPIQNLRNMGLIAGFPDNTFRPEQFLTKGIAARVVLSAYQYDPKYLLDVPNLDGSEGLKDLTLEGPYSKYLVKAEKLGILARDNDGLFNPNSPISRADFMKLVLLPSGDDFTSFDQIQIYKDIPINTWFSPYMNFAGQMGLILPDNKGYMYPSQKITRAEATETAYILYLMLKKDNNSLVLTQLKANTAQAIYFAEQNKYKASKRQASVAQALAEIAYQADPTNEEVLIHAKLAKSASYASNYLLLNGKQNTQEAANQWKVISTVKLDEAKNKNKEGKLSKEKQEEADAISLQIQNLIK